MIKYTIDILGTNINLLFLIFQVLILPLYFFSVTLLDYLKVRKITNLVNKTITLYII